MPELKCMHLDVFVGIAVSKLLKGYQRLVVRCEAEAFDCGYWLGTGSAHIVLSLHF